MSAPVRVWIVVAGTGELVAVLKCLDPNMILVGDEVHEYILASSLSSERETQPSIPAVAPATGPEAA